MLTVNNLALIVNGFNIFSNIGITALPSSITYLTGDNGSGKTSMLRMIAGIQAPSSGYISYGTKATLITELPKPYCLYIGHNNAIKPEYTVIENIAMWAKFYESPEAIDAAIYYFRLNEITHQKCYELSAGNKQKVALARLLTCRSNIWLLDEVDQNLDKSNRDLLDKLIVTKADNGGIILLTTHEKPRIKSASILNLHSEYDNSATL